MAGTAAGYLLVGAGAYSTDAVTATAGQYVDMGGFREDLRISFSEERFNLEVADRLAFIKSVRTRLDCFINTSLVENRIRGLAMVLGTNAQSLNIGHASAGYDGLSALQLLVSDPGSNAQNQAHSHQFVGDDATDPASAELITWTFSAAVPNVDTELAYRKDGEVLIPSTFMCLGVDDGSGVFGFGNVT